MIIIYSSMISPILYHGANLMVKFRGPHQPNSIQWQKDMMKHVLRRSNRSTWKRYGSFDNRA